MFDWIPLIYYTPIYYYVMLTVVLITLLNSQVLAINDRKNKSYLQVMGIFVLLFVVFYMGLRPISGRFFGDMGTYAIYFENYQAGNPITIASDFFFHMFMQFSSKIMNVQLFFMVCALLYVMPLYMVCKKWFPTYWFYGFLMLVVSFSFWSFGTNGIRNGIAGSIFLLAISREKHIFQILWLLLAVNFHMSILLPSIAFILVQFHNKPKTYLLFWLLCIPLSLAAGGVWENLFASLGFDDDRLSYLTEGNINDDDFAYMGFRWDFLLYSTTGVFAGWYFIFKKKFEDPIYAKLFNIYLFANAFWILVIRANFSNRFAYLSWFILALVIIYPLIEKQIVTKQYKKIGWLLVAYFAFTFMLNIILS